MYTYLICAQHGQLLWSVVLIYVIHLLVQRTNPEADYPKNFRINYLHSPYISIFRHIIQSQILMTSDLFSLISTLMNGTKVVIFRSKMYYILSILFVYRFVFIIYERFIVISLAFPYPVQCFMP